MPVYSFLMLDSTLISALHMKTTSKKHTVHLHLNRRCISNVFIINVSIIYVHDKLKKNHNCRAMWLGET